LFAFAFFANFTQKKRSKIRATRYHACLSVEVLRDRRGFA
jgi:hypothetical protein